jgi:prepilin-type N-terminal cleavage/methylation domain-containing protein
MKRGRTQRGFTLLEVVMAISLMCGVLVILFTGLRLSMNAWRRGTERIEAADQSFAITEALQIQASAAVPMKLFREEDKRREEVICFRGSAQQVRFLTRKSWAGDRSRGLWMATYQVVDAKDGLQQQLLVTETPMLDSSLVLNALLEDDIRAARTQVYGEPADHIELSYWQAGTQALPAAWVSDWKAAGAEKLPRGIQVRWQRRNGEQMATFAIPVVREVK